MQNTLCHDLLDPAKDLSKVMQDHVDQESDKERVFLKIWPHFVKGGFHRLLIDSRLGGWGLELKQYINVLRILANGDGALALGVHVHNIAVKMISELGDETFRDRLATWIEEGKIFALARSEHGRDYRYDFSTRVSQEKVSMILSGQKDFCTLAGLADYYVVFAQTEAIHPSMNSLQVCIASGKAPAVEVIKSNSFDAMVASSTHSLRFNHYVLTPTELVGKPGAITALLNPDILSLGICAINLGMSDSGMKLFLEKQKNLDHNVELIRWLGLIDVLRRSTELLLNDSIHSRPHSVADSGVCLRRAKASSDMLIREVTEGTINHLGMEGIISKNKFIYLRNNSYATQLLPPNTQKCLLMLGTELRKHGKEDRN